MSSKSPRRRTNVDNPFKGLRNIGPAARADLAVLGIGSIEQLAACDPDELYSRLQFDTARKHDPCVWDVFAAAIHQARTGEARDWWTFARERKLRQAHIQLRSGQSNKAGVDQGASAATAFHLAAVRQSGI
jgi:hypothetical protein